MEWERKIQNEMHISRVLIVIYRLHLFLVIVYIKGKYASFTTYDFLDILGDEFGLKDFGSG
jgi:hypothetical protein